MKKLLSALLFVLLFVAFSLLTSPIATADRQLPPNDRAKGLIYNDLEVPQNGECKGAFKVKVKGAKAGDEPQCSHGPDPFPQSIAFAKPSSQTPTPTPVPSGPGTVMCDSDGVSGKRVQVLYVRASTMPSKYGAYLASFQQWAADADAFFNSSAAKTGGSRRVRFVHDAGCKPVVTEVVLTAWGMESFGNMVSELNAQGFNRRDRKYMIFADTSIYCGIGSVVADDSAGTKNKSNAGPHYGRVDVNCWDGAVAAHELMHTLGGVQLSAPNSDGNWHCNDGYDLMCDYSGHNVQILCSGTPGQSPFDCGNNDYFHNNPPANSYLATHWNPASNQFLINPTATTRK